MMWSRLIIAGMMLMLGAEAAHARRSSRTGLNFGANLRIVNDSDRGAASTESATKSNVSKTVNTVAPFLGFVLGDHLNIGISALTDQSQDIITEDNTESGSSMYRRRNTDVRGASIFMRFLFADVMYFEAGGGVYEQRTAILNEYKFPTNGTSFTGSQEEYVVRGIGTGYNLGAGIELPIVNGFYFASGYNMRAFQLRDYRGTNDLGRKLSRVERREFTFGISHYLK